MIRLFILLSAISFNGLEESSFVEFSVNLSKPKDHHFPEIYDYIRTKVEGNYVNHPDDKGGETYGGVARRLHPKWYGWKYVDQDKTKYRHKRIESAEIWVKDFYLNLWVKEGFENIKDKELAKNLFDFRIHSSPKSVTKLTNNVLLQMGYCPIKVGENWITEDFNHLNAQEFILRLKIQRIILFNQIVTKNPRQRVFYRGWIERIENI
jgi:lysozyme family protein